MLCSLIGTKRWSFDVGHLDDNGRWFHCPFYHYYIRSYFYISRTPKEWILWNINQSSKFLPVIIGFLISSCLQTTGEVKEYYLLICNRGSYFRLIQSWTFIHKLIVHSASLYFSFRTRKIKISVLNEYKSSSAIAYSTIIFVFLTAVLLFPLAGYPNIYVFCYTLLLFTMVSLFVSLTFIPKVYIYMLH